MKFASVKVLNIMTVYLDCTLVYIIEAHQKFYHGGLTCSGRTYNGNFLSVLYICRKIMDNDLIRVIAKLYMFELNISI